MIKPYLEEKIGSYQVDNGRPYNDKYDYNRAINKTLGIGIGASCFIIGLICLTVNVLAGLIGIVGGVGLFTFAVTYYRKFK